MVMEVFLDPNKDIVGNRERTLLLSHNSISQNLVKDDILVKFGECGLASSLNSFQGSIKACKNADLKCEMSKFEHYKLLGGNNLNGDVEQQMKNCLEKIKVLEH
ncbi:unnamed protein product [Cuscuta epithymum]|uniref:Uncharacterized protein n=1 Tax=Cuscuta epithymum TaxID=186058 RepID=A0AAV0D0Q8_9ASTE|nr:unnamed protein product [Cuscuta epithymum]